MFQGGHVPIFATYARCQLYSVQSPAEDPCCRRYFRELYVYWRVHHAGLRL